MSIHKSSYWGDDPKDDQNGANNNFNNFKKPSGGNGNLGPKRFGFLYVLIGVVLILFLGNGLLNLYQNISNVSYTEFLYDVDNGNVKTVTVTDNRQISYKRIDGQNKKTTIALYDADLLKKLQTQNVDIKGAERKPSILSTIFNLLPFILFIYIAIAITRGAKNLGAGGAGGLFGMGGMGGNIAREYKPNSKDAVHFSDVAGQAEAKEELMEVVEFLKNPKKFSQIGARIPRGVLLVGPPGTGKTLIARAVAGESKVSFLYTSGSDFVEMFVGMGASRVRSLFAEAKKKSPCIIFIDEIDAVGRSRGAGLGGGHDEREQTLNQILVEMDGFNNEKGIIVMAATNRADVLDDALLRPGRFDRRVAVELPDVKEREEILKLHFKPIKTGSDIDLARIARATPGSSGADLANLANESALLAARNNKPYVTMQEVEDARDKILLGIARGSRVMTPEQKTATAYHEAGHTLLHYYVKSVDPLHKVTIIPHGNALGLTMSLPENDMLCRDKDYLLGRIKIAMGGYVAEELVYGQTTTGTSNDIKQATHIAQMMVTQLGMSSLGFVNYSDEDQPIFLGREIAQHKNYSEETAKQIDAEVRKIIDSCMADVKNILKEHRDQLDIITQNLVEKETLDDNEIRDLLGLEEVTKASDLV